jgi:hypothetical protein
MIFRFLKQLCLILVMTGCASTTPITNNPQPVDDVSKFSTMSLTQEISNEETSKKLKGWHPWSVTPSKAKTHYKFESSNGKIVIFADAKSSASGLMINLKPQSIQGADLSWQWKALEMIPGANNSQGHTDDAPLRLILAFDGDKKTLNFRDQMAFEMAHLISGREMPYATLMYIWANDHPVEEIISNKYTSRLKVIVVDSGAEHLGEWRTHQRNIEEDYQKAYNEKPGNLIGMAILTDTDNTKTQVKAVYGDIEIKRK